MTRTKFYLYPTKLDIVIKGEKIRTKKQARRNFKTGFGKRSILSNNCVICFHSPTIWSCGGYRNFSLLGLDKIGFWKKIFPETTFQSKGKELLEFTNGLSQLLATNERKGSHTFQNRKISERVVLIAGFYFAKRNFVFVLFGRLI